MKICSSSADRENTTRRKMENFMVDRSISSVTSFARLRRLSWICLKICSLSRPLDNTRHSFPTFIQSGPSEAPGRSDAQDAGNSFVIFVHANDSLVSFPSPSNFPTKSPPVKMHQLYDPPAVARSRLPLHRICIRIISRRAPPIVHGHNSKAARGIT